MGFIKAEISLHGCGYEAKFKSLRSKRKYYLWEIPSDF